MVETRQSGMLKNPYYLKIEKKVDFSSKVFEAT